ncbi:MAG TPA: hypothetical protein PLK78_06820 [Verrucomicrobiota bacterium]|nr:hypothetical protein [Verrucomicrobiota bacterium]
MNEQRGAREGIANGWGERLATPKLAKAGLREPSRDLADSSERQ